MRNQKVVVEMTIAIALVACTWYISMHLDLSRLIIGFQNCIINFPILTITPW